MTPRRIALIAALLATGCSGGGPSTTSTGGGSGSASAGSSSSSSSGSASSSSGTSSGSTASGSSSTGTSGSSGTGTGTGTGSGSTGSTGSTGAITQPPPFVTSVSVEGAGQPEIRQGGNAIVHIEGENLQNASAVELGGQDVAITRDSSSEIIGGVTVAHGTAPGPLDLAVSTLGGSTTFAAAVSITPITVSATGDDSAGGVPSAPFQTVSHALAVATSVDGGGDTVLLLPGTYTSDRESFPTGAQPQDFRCNIADGLTLAGAGDAGANPVLLDVSDAGAAPLVPCGSALLSNLDVNGFAYGIVVENGVLRLANVHQSGAADDGLYVSGVSSVATTVVGSGDSSFDSNGNAGIAVVNQATFTGSGVQANGNAVGLSSQDALDLSVHFSKLDHDDIGLSVSGNTLVSLGPSIETSDDTQGGVELSASRSVSITGLLAERDGLGVLVTGPSNAVTMSDSYVDSSGVGLEVDTAADAGSTVAVASSSFVQNGRGVLLRGAPQSVNLNAITAGANTLQRNLVNLEVDVPAGSLVSMRGVVFDANDGAAYPDASDAGGENVPWVYNGTTYIDATGLTQAPLMWNPDAGEGPFNYLLFDGGGQIQF